AGHTGARTITVPTLLIDDATALLERRIGTDRARSDLTATHNLAALCDGLPLALWLASEHVAGRPDTALRDLVEHLRDQRRLLDAGSHGDGDTLRAVFDLSADSLPSDADRLYQLLGLHPSNVISTAAAAAMAGLPARRTELVLDVLVGAHLVSQPAIDSCQTHDLLHMHADDRARARMSEEQVRVAERRMADWYLLTSINAVARLTPLLTQVPPMPHLTDVAPMTFRDKDEALRWCVRERPQVMAVARHAARVGLHDHVWRQVGTFTDLLNRYDDPRPVIDMHRIALDSARAVGARDGETGLLNNLGAVEFRVGRFDAASRHFEQALVAFRELGDEPGESMALFNLANVLLEQGSLRRAVELHRQSLAIAVRIGEKPQQARIYRRLADAQHRLEHPDLAVEHLSAAMALLTEIGDERGLAAALTQLAELRLAARHVDQAVDLCEQALAINRAVVDERQTAAALRVLAWARYRQGLHDEAITCAQDSVTLCQRMHDPRGEARSLDALASAYAAVGQRELARGIWRNAMALCRTTGDAYAAKIAASLEDDPTRPVG
ncbi:MAG TPA: tetratricopeptide repeat protein, partial [Pseudonocardiaceae bacterium]|nr:tetratricopeptide repeat protein [Pseudonocardiaceae bacterium]